MIFSNYQQSWSKDISNDVLSLFRSNSEKTSVPRSSRNVILTSFGEYKVDSKFSDILYGSIGEEENVSRCFSNKNYTSPLDSTKPSVKKFNTASHILISGIVRPNNISFATNEISGFQPIPLTSGGIAP